MLADSAVLATTAARLSRIFIAMVAASPAPNTIAAQGRPPNCVKQDTIGDMNNNEQSSK